MGKHLVLVGGGHAHLTCLKELRHFRDSGHSITLISPSPHHYYSGMGPGMLSGMYRPQEVRFNIKRMTEHRGGVFMADKVIRIEPGEHTLFLASGQKVRYDLVSFNTGSEVPVDSLMPSPEENVFPVKPVINLLDARRSILESNREKALNLVVLGGGPAGLEVSANLCRLIHGAERNGRITLIAGRRLMADFPDTVRSLALTSLSGRGVEVIEGNYVKAIGKETVTLKDDRRLPYDFTFVAVGIRPSSFFRDSGLPTGKDGGLLVNPYLQSVSYPDLFGGGDCVSLEGHSIAKVGVYAVRQNPILYHNLLAALEGGQMKAFQPQKDYLLIFNMGNGRGLFTKRGWTWEGRFPLLLKDYIDRRFMKTFQVSKELEEETL